LLRRLAHQYHPEVFAHPLPGPAAGSVLDPRDRLVGYPAIAFVFDERDRMLGHAAGVREARDDGCLGVVDRLVPAFRASKWSSSGCADAADNGAVVVYWKKLKQAQGGSDDVLTESMVDERPVFLSGPPLEYPGLLRQAGIQGRVMVRAIIDSTGYAEPGSVQVIESPNHGFDQSAKRFVLQAQFRRGRFHGRAVRVLIEFPVEFRMGR
jgi:TonB family protein